MSNVAFRKKPVASNPCANVEFPVAIKGLFRTHYVPWSGHQQIEFHAPAHLRNVVCIMTEAGLRVYEELLPMKREHVDFVNSVVWIFASRTSIGISELPLTRLALDAFRNRIAISGSGNFSFPAMKHQPNT
jgi:integrase